MTERLLSIPGTYWSVFYALFRTVIGIAFWAIFNTIFDLSSNQTTNVEPIPEGGLGWLVYVIAALVLDVVLSSHGAPGWLIHLVIAVEILAVPPLYWTFHRDAQPDPKPKVTIEDVASVVPLPDAVIPTAEAAEFLRSDVPEPTGRDAKGAPGRGGRR